MRMYFRPHLQGVKVRQHVDMYAPHEKEPLSMVELRGLWGKTLELCETTQEFGDCTLELWESALELWESAPE